MLLFPENRWLQELQDATTAELQAMPDRPSRNQLLREDYKELAQLVFVVLCAARSPRPLDGQGAVLPENVHVCRTARLQRWQAEETAPDGDFFFY